MRHRSACSAVDPSNTHERRPHPRTCQPDLESVKTLTRDEGGVRNRVRDRHGDVSGVARDLLPTRRRGHANDRIFAEPKSESGHELIVAILDGDMHGLPCGCVRAMCPDGDALKQHHKLLICTAVPIALTPNRFLFNDYSDRADENEKHDPSHAGIVPRSLEP